MIASPAAVAARIVATLSLLSVLLVPVRAQPHAAPKRVLALYWFDRQFAIDLEYDRDLQAHLRTVLGGQLEYYSEYLDMARFPGENQSQLVRNFLRQKYADRPIDVVVTNVPTPLEFLFRYRDTLFSDAKIVFANNDWPSREDLMTGAGATGIVFAMTHKETMKLALKLQPGTQRVFVVSGTLDHTKAYEKTARAELADLARRTNIVYLTDLSPEELTARIRTVPKRSVILYIRQYVRDRTGKLFDPADCLTLIGHAATAPVYVLASANIRDGVTGGDVWTIEGNAAKLAELVLRVLGGTRPADIPIERAPSVPMVDWRQLLRWGIRENSLPPGAIVLHREPTFWQQYRGRIVVGIAILALQMLLIGLLLIERERTRRSAEQLLMAQQVLRESEERFRKLADTAPVMIAVTDHSGAATFFNKTWLDFTGCTMEQETGFGWAERLHPDDRDETISKVRVAQQEHCECIVEYRLRRADGEYRSIMCRGIPRFDADTKYAGHLASAVDITDLKQVLANQKLESLGVLTSGIAHDFNNFLGGILATAELLLVELADSPARQEVESIRLASTRAAEVIRQLMAYAGDEGTAFENLDLSSLVDEMRGLMELSVSKCAALTINIPADLPPIRGNAQQIRQILMNLITNASDALYQGEGEISVTAASLERTEEGAASEAAGQRWVQLEVRDSGRGMTEEVQTRLFEPFFSTKGAGRGMGMAAVQGIVNSLGGTIKVMSRVGEGSRFIILLPCAGRKDGIRILPTPRSHDYQDSPRTVLIIEDEEALREPIARMLRKRGFLVLVAGDGVRGVELFRAHSGEIGTVLLDLTLPGLSGPEVLKELQKSRPDVRVVLTTAYGRARAFEDVDQPVFVSYLRKPYEINEVTSLLKELCHEPAEHKQAAG